MTKQQKNKELDLLKNQVPAFAEKCQPIYQILYWTWNNEGKLTTSHIPSVLEIENCLYSLIENVRDKNIISSSTGGLKVCYLEENEKEDRPQAECCMSFSIQCHSYEGEENG